MMSRTERLGAKAHGVPAPHRVFLLFLHIFLLYIFNQYPTGYMYEKTGESHSSEESNGTTLPFAQTWDDLQVSSG